MNSCQRPCSDDKGLNHLQQGNAASANIKCMIPCQRSNQAIDDLLYNSLDLTPAEKADLDQTLYQKGIIDAHGNQRQSRTIDHISWDHENSLQCTIKEQTDGTTIREYNVYPIPGSCSRKVTETINADGNYRHFESFVNIKREKLDFKIKTYRTINILLF